MAHNDRSADVVPPESTPIPDRSGPPVRTFAQLAAEADEIWAEDQEERLEELAEQPTHLYSAVFEASRIGDVEFSVLFRATSHFAASRQAEEFRDKELPSFRTRLVQHIDENKLARGEVVWL